MLITLIGLVLVVLAAMYVAWPLLSPAEPASEVAPPASDRVTALKKEKDAALAAIRELDFDHQVGKLSAEDHAAARAELETRALGAMRALDDAGITSPEGAALRAVPSPEAAKSRSFCPSCGHAFGEGATFCAGCGTKRPRPERASGRRRA